jgi:Tol biopolymer transport system component
LKRYFGIFFGFMLFGLALATQAQDEPEPTQSVADAVSTLLAQTQQAPTQINMTQAVQEALEQALTATAQAAIPAPVDAATVEVISTTDFDLNAGPGNTSAYLAPDGKRFVHREGENLCLYAQDAAEPTCAQLPEPLDGTFYPESLVWSPDSRYVTFAENFLVYFVDSDIWVWDTTTDAVTDLTDDGPNRLDFDDDSWEGIDLAPTWLPDGRILFLRYSRIDDETPPAEIYAMEPNGSNLEKMGELDSSGTFAAYAMTATEEHLFYNYYVNGDAPKNGVWMSNRDGSNPKQIFASEVPDIPWSLSTSSDGRYVLMNLPLPNDLNFSPEQSAARLLDVESGEEILIDPDHFVAGAGWSPDGTALIYIVNDRRATTETDNGLYVTGTPGENGRRILEGEWFPTTSRQQQPLTWGANHTTLLTRFPEFTLTLVELGSE